MCTVSKQDVDRRTNQTRQSGVRLSSVEGNGKRTDVKIAIVNNSNASFSSHATDSSSLQSVVKFRDDVACTSLFPNTAVHTHQVLRGQCDAQTKRACDGRREPEPAAAAGQRDGYRSPVLPACL